MFAGSEKVGMSPQPKLSTVSGVKSINLTVGLENTNVADVLRRNSHSKILEWLQNKNLGDTAFDRTLSYHILKNTINGDKIVSQKLDECVTTNNLESSDPDYKLHIDFSRLVGQEGSMNSDILRDILSIKHEAAEKLLLHPVLETFVNLKWKKTKKFFFLNFLIYFLFLLSFSLFLGNIFYRPMHRRTVLVIDDIRFPKDTGNQNNGIWFNFKPKPARSSGALKTKDNVLFLDKHGITENISSSNQITRLKWSNNATFSGCSPDTWSPSCIVEMVLSLTLALLLTIEILQLMSVGIRAYVTNFENMIELTVISLAAVCLSTQEFEEVEKWFSAFGIVLAYLELVFLLGRYPPLGGRISIMFYNITRHLTKSLINLFVLVIGFAYGFFIMHRNTPNDNFENPFKSIVKTLMMVLGEYEFNDMFDGRFDDMPYAYAFNLALLTLLAIIGSLVMVNLFVAIIVSDIEQLKHDGKIEETRQKIYHIINIENTIACLWRSKRDETENWRKMVCTHSICFGCKGIKVPPSSQKELEEMART